MSTLLVASGGGHLKQLHRLLPRLPVGGERTWLTFDTGLSRSLLAGEDVVWAPYADPHDVRGSARDLWCARKLLKSKRFDRAISTGANLAVTTLPLARLHGVRADYIESATRSWAPSLSGQILEKVPGVGLYTQHESQAKGRWKFAGSVFDGFKAQVIEQPTVDKVVVTLGSNDTYPFDKLVEQLRDVLPSGVEVLWQLGNTPIPSGLANAHAKVPAAELEQAMREAQVVIAHAGTGSALSALEAGRLPMLVPRRSERGEHIDDHQEATAMTLQARGLASYVEADELTWHDIWATAGWQITDQTASLPPLRLDP